MRKEATEIVGDHLYAVALADADAGEVQCISACLVNFNSIWLWSQSIKITSPGFSCSDPGKFASGCTTCRFSLLAISSKTNRAAAIAKLAVSSIVP